MRVRVFAASEEETLPRLDVRLKKVAEQIRASRHADIGSDHGNLLVALLKSGRVEHGIAIENKVQPYENSRAALTGLNADARFADGLQGLRPGEVDSLSICGMGGESMVAILQAYPDRIPSRIVLQPNRRPDLVREWALANRFHLMDEQIARGHWPYVILVYHLGAQDHDPAFNHVDHEADLMLGPLTLQRREPEFVEQLFEERRYLHELDRLSDVSGKRLAVIERVLRRWQENPI
ncbi:MAG: tRNA (adenine(22)-N(1))-methyltransferase [Rubripirellula sp.]